MPRVEIATQPWGWLVNATGQPLGNTSALLEEIDGTDATTWSAITGGSSSTAALTSNADGTLPRYVEEGSYTLTVSGVTRRVEATIGGAVRHAGAEDPVNTQKVYISESGDAPALITALDVDLTTPDNVQFFVGRKETLDRLVSPDPGNYNWGIFAYEVNAGTAPVTPLAARGRGETVYTISSSGRAYGADPEIHGIEITAGIHPSEATVTTANGSSTLTPVAVTQDGSRFEAGMTITGTGIPAATTILSVAGAAGAPTSITMSANATASASGIAVLAESATTTGEAIGLLVTGNAGSSANIDHMDAAIQVQSQQSAGRWLYAVNVGASGLHQTNGVAFRLASATASRGLSIESCTLADAIVVSGGSMSNAAIRINVDAPIKIGQAVGAGKGYLEMWEQSVDATAPSADAARLFVKDNGAGKSQLVIRFNTGATQVIATQP